MLILRVVGGFLVFLIKLLTFIVSPVFRVIGFPLPTSLGLMLFSRNIRFYRSYFYTLSFASFYLFIVLFFNNITDLNISSLFYFVFPIIYLLLIHAFMPFKELDNIIKIYFYVNILVVIATTTFKIMPTFLEAYYSSYIFGNITTENHYLQHIANRGVGLLGHPAWLGLMAYMLGKYLTIKEGKYRYVLLSIIPIILSGGRAALFSLAIIEVVTLFYKHRKHLIKLISYTILATLLLSVMFYLTYKLNDNFNYWINITYEDLMYGGDFRSASISHRIGMFAMLFEQNILSLLFGNGSMLTQMDVNAIDSELVMRTLQFGLIGFLLLLLPVLNVYRNSKLSNNQKGKEMSFFILLFLILGSITTTVASNMIFIVYISVIISRIERTNNQYLK